MGRAMHNHRISQKFGVIYGGADGLTDFGKMKEVTIRDNEGPSIRPKLSSSK